MRTTNHRLLTAMALAVGMTAAQPAAPTSLAHEEADRGADGDREKDFTQALGDGAMPCGAIF